MNQADLLQLDFDKILTLLQERCSTHSAREAVMELPYYTDLQTVKGKLTEAHECATLDESDTQFDWGSLQDVSTLLPYIAIAGNYLLETDFMQLRRLFSGVHKLTNYLIKRNEQAPILSAKVKDCPDAQVFIKRIDLVFAPDGTIRPNASPGLVELTVKIGKAQNDARKRLDALAKMAREKGWSPETSLTYREGRLVIPLFAEHKRSIKGLIHDESSTGQTVYLEPTEVFEFNNELRELELAKQREIIRILTELTFYFAEHLIELRHYQALVLEFDTIQAKSKLARAMDATMPILSKEPEIQLLRGRHPLLYLQLKKAGRKVVPLSLKLTKDERVLVISGPNAGGKSVAMKTIGVLSAMVQHGLLPPCEASSKFGIFSGLLCDIGDQQSIENDLSTYSSHLTNMRRFLAEAAPDTLCLIDEFGTGTDPTYGGPIAEAVMEALVERGTFAVITTHYSNLKLLASRVPAVANGAMGFDGETLSPQYTLSVGEPGSSFALELAKNSGLPSEVLEEARQKIGSQQHKLEDILLELQAKQRELEAIKALSTIKDDMLAEALVRTEQREKDLKAQKASILANARNEAKQLLKDAQRTLERTFREQKAAQSPQSVEVVAQKARETIERLKTKTEAAFGVEEVKAPEDEEAYVLQEGEEPFKKGETIVQIGKAIPGIIVELDKKRALVEQGSIKMWVPLGKLQRVKTLPKKHKVQTNYGSLASEAIQTFESNADVRGMRVIELQGYLDEWIDKALLANVSHLRLLHGKGEGQLRKFVREYLRTHSAVSDFQAEHADRGGEGITLITLR